MIDFENYIIDKVYTAIKAEYPNANITSMYVPIPSVFPHIYIRETDNFTDAMSHPIAGFEGNIRITYVIDIFDNSDNRKNVCKKLSAIVDDTMQRMYFIRSMCSPMPNEYDSSVYRITMRYTKLQGKFMEEIL